MRSLAPLAIVAACVVLVVTATGGGPDGHRLTAMVPEATNLIAGQELKAGGGAIGKIEKLEAIDGGSRAKLTLRIDDDAWPLPRGTRFNVRYGGTASFYNRHILVSPAKDSGQALSENEMIPTADFVVPVEVDKLLATFDTKVRRDLKSFINRSGAALGRSPRQLERVLDVTPQAVNEGAAVVGDLVDDRGALDASVRRTDAVVDAVRRADPGLTTLLTGAAQTFSAIADEQAGLSTTLERMPAMLTQVQGTLKRAHGTLIRARRLAGRIAPGVRQLRAAARPVDQVLSSLLDVAPDARATLATVRRSSPSVNALLARATKVSPQLGSIGDKAVENLECIRPWTPEIMGLLMTWADFMSHSDGKDKILRAQVQNFLPANYNAVPLKTAQVASMNPGLRYGFPRPPGYNAGQVWFQPKCGAGPDALDPAKDQESSARPTPPPSSGSRR